MTTNTPARTAGNALASIQGLKGALQTVRQNIHMKGGKPFLKMDKGVWTYGQDNVEVEEGSHWAINPLSIMVGWVCWKVIPPGNPHKEKPENLGEEMVPLGQTPPAKHTLPVLEYPWNEQVSFDLVCVSGEDKGEEVNYKTSSNGGKGACDEVIKALLEQLGKDEVNAVPVVELKSDSYPNKTYGGRTFYPIFEIVKWVPMDVMPEEAEGDEPETETEQPAPEPEQPAPAAAPAGRRRGAAPQPAPEPTQPAAAAPEQRRRRRG